MKLFKPECVIYFLSDIIYKLKDIQGSAIVYTATRRDADTLAKKLQKAGIKCLSYHAGLQLSTRKSRQSKWMENSVSTMVATCAFGLGELLT